MRGLGLRRRLGRVRRGRRQEEDHKGMDDNNRGQHGGNGQHEAVSASGTWYTTDSVPWRNHYEMMPVEFPRQTERTFSAETWWIVDLSHRPRLTEGATPLVVRCMEAYGWKEELARRVLDGYHQFWQIKKIHEDWHDNIICPSVEIDKMWQQHILDVVRYVNDSMLFCGHIVLRQPEYENTDGQQNLERLAASLMEKRQTTKTALQAYASKNYVFIDEFVWYEVINWDKPELYSWKPKAEYEKSMMGVHKFQRKLYDIIDKVVNDSASVFTCSAPSFEGTNLSLPSKQEEQAGISNAGKSFSGSVNQPLPQETPSRLSLAQDVNQFVIQPEDRETHVGFHEDLGLDPDMDSQEGIPPPPVTSVPRRTRSLFDAHSEASTITQKSQVFVDVKPDISTRSHRPWHFFDNKSAASSKSTKSKGFFQGKSVSSTRSRKSRTVTDYTQAPLTTKSRKSRSFLDDDKSHASTKSQRTRVPFDEQSHVSTRSRKSRVPFDERTHISSKSQKSRSPSDEKSHISTKSHKSRSSVRKMHQMEHKQPYSFHQENSHDRFPTTIDTSVAMDPTTLFRSPKVRSTKQSARTPFSSSAPSLVHNTSTITDASNIPKLTIRLRDDEEISYLKISYAARMGKVFEAYANRKGIAVSELRFFTPAGDVIGHDTDGTAAFYGLEDQDQILVTRIEGSIDLDDLLNDPDKHGL